VYEISELKCKITSKSWELFPKRTNTFFKHCSLLETVIEARNNAIKMGCFERLKSRTPCFERLKSRKPTLCCIREMHKIFKIKIIAAVNIYRRALKFLCLEFGA
jgi:hypothetical protein